MMIDLYNADCFNKLKDIPDKSVDLLLTDPPYNFDSSRGSGLFAQKNKDGTFARNYLQKLENLSCCTFEPARFLDLVKTKLKHFNAFIFCNKTLLAEYLNFAIANGYKYDVLVLAKTNPVPAYNNHHLSDLEYVVFIRDSKAFFSHHKNMDDYRKWFIVQCTKHNSNHPAEKPVELLERYIRCASQEGDVVLDPFMGSGSTGCAAVSQNRNFIGIECNAEWFEVAQKRLRATEPKKNTETKQMELFEVTT